MTGFATDPMRYITGVEEARAKACFLSYMDSYTGAWFERLADPDPFCITAADVVAVSTLAVEVPAGVSIWLTEEQRDDGRDASIPELLRAIPTDSDIGHVDETVLAHNSPADQLWRLLQANRWPDGPVANNGLGAVTAGKLLAAKRPALIPIWDQCVDRGLGPPRGAFWTTMRARFRDPTFVTQLRRVHNDAMTAVENSQSRMHPGGVDVPKEPTLLRTLDIIVWMRVCGYAHSRDPEVQALRSKPLGEP